ncbi:AAA family ATPase, partial [Arthrobacter sulfonylureivorans]|uniref:AAA family ATPase n=1 Tax=Arthrobacter sulfonylureivorans TaxID=2486855 RepID=UPI0039E2257D
MKTIALCNFKGGSGKTTSAAFLAHAFAQLGRSVVVVDADPQGSLLRWSEEADWGIPTLALPTKTIHRQLPGIVGDRYDIALIDTPGFNDRTGIVYAAIRAADLVVLPMAPTMMELERVPHVLAAVDEVAVSRDIELPHRVLLNRTITNASSTQVIRDQLAELGCDVLPTAIPRREVIGQALGEPVEGPLYG